MAGASLLALVEAWVGSGDAASAKKLQAALGKAAASSRDSREAREAALKAFKLVQHRLSSADLGSDAAEQLAGLGRAALAALAAGGGGTKAQLAGWRYNFARRLVSARAYTSAHVEARELLCQLNEQAGATQCASAGCGAATTETASIAVGASLTLVLSCVEGRLLDEAKAVDAMLAAADSLPSWLSQLGADEAARHSEAAYKYLYKAGMGLLEQRCWQQLASVCGGLVAAAGGDVAAQRRALAAAAKLVAHMPGEEAAAAVAAVAAKVCSERSSVLGTEAGSDLLGMLCSAAQRATSASAARVLSEAALSCGRSKLPLLRVAPLLLPALALQLPPERDPDWLVPVSAAVGLVNTSLQQLQAPLPSGTAQQPVAMLQAAYHPANVLRRALAAQLAASDKAGAAAGCSGDACQRLGGPAAARLVAVALEILAGAVGAGSRQPHEGTSSTLGSQGHAAAVALVTAARLRAACLLQQAGGSAASDHGDMECTASACGRLLGWGLQQFCSACSELPPAACAVEPQELSWMASALFNVGLDLHAAQRHAAAVPVLRAAAAAAAVGLQIHAKGSPPVEDKAARLADFCRKCAVLASAQQQAGDLACALGSLGHSLALLLRLGISQPAAWDPLVEAFVRLQCEAANEQEMTVQVVSEAPQPARRGRGAASKKAAGSTAAAGSGAASSSQASGCITLLVELMQQQEADLPSCSIAAVLEHELLCWGAALQGDGLAPPAAVSAAFSGIVKRLLQAVFPAKAQPVLHATALLALFKAGLPADDGQCGLALLERASAALNKVPGKAAYGVLARARCWQAVDGGRQHACQVLLEQQQERQRSHAAASTSAAGSREQDAEAVGQLAGSTAGHAAAWQRVVQQAELAVETLESASSTTAAPAEFEELAWLLGLHGRDAAAHQLSLLLPGSVQPVGGALAGCLFPGASASAAELQQQAEDAATEASRASTGSAMQRAALHGQAAEACAAAGNMVPALFHAAEGHRLLAVLFYGGSDAAGAGPVNSARPGWWRLAAAYMGSLLQLGQLFEAAGQADEALHSLREGQRLAVAAGAAPVAAAFAARMADILCKQGELEEAEQAAAAAERQLEAVPDSTALAVAYCKAAVQLVRAQLRLAGGGGCPGKAIWQACQAAVASCEALTANSASNGTAAGSFCAALHAAALLTLGEAASQRDDAAGARQHATDALGVADVGGACSALRCQRAAALVFLGRHPASGAAAEQHLSIWGLGANECGRSASGDSDAAAAPKSRAKKQPASRGQNKAAAVAAEAAVAEDVGSSSAHAMQRLWQALECSRGLLPTHREAAALLAVECGRLGYLHLAALLLHCALGAALQLQYQLVLFSRRQQLAQRQRRGMGVGDAASELPAQLQQLERLSAVLLPQFDWQVVQQLAICSSASASKPAAASASRGRRAPAAAAAAGVPSCAAALAALDQQAARQLQAWLASLPADTAVCSIGTLPGSQGGSILISRLSPGASVGEPPRPPLLVVLPVQQLSASLSQHPIRALRLDDDAADDACSAGVGSVQSVLDEMAAVLAESGRSMREMSTETKEQQREWWRARLALDDRLAALTKHLGSSWLGPWRCLLLGTPPGSSSSSQGGEAAAQHLLGLLTAAGQPASQQQAGVLQHAAALLVQRAGSMSQGELRQAAHQLCVAAGLACSQEQQRQLEDLLLAAPAARHGVEAETEAAEAATPRKASRGGKSVKFADVAASEQQAEEGGDPVVSAASSNRAGRGRRLAAARGRRGAAAAAAAADEMAAESSTSGGGDASPVATLAAVGGGADLPMAAGGGLCQALDALSLADAPAPATAAAAPATGPAGVGTTARSGKHRSRLRMLQAGTPAVARKTAAAAGAATAPRPARELPLTVAKTAPPPAARSSGANDGGAAAAADGGPVLLVLDGALQALPWESAAGLLGQRLYRMPNLACAAASAQRASTSVDLSSTFYALNPSGDLATTQATFQDWFRGMKGWEGKAGCAPTAAELAAALQRHAFFLYCGHGGGEQYISVTKLRSLERCSAALLMGCSSGRLRARRHYEPAGAVLAYLLAGCPAAVANLWDVTDRDIDRFSQAVLTAYISSGSSGSATSGSTGSRTKSGSGDENSEPLGTDMSAAVGASRGVCKLPHLVGAAPVCYGLPSRAFLG